MKSWRMIPLAALAVSVAAQAAAGPSVGLALPLAPTQAGSPGSPGSPDSGGTALRCEPDLTERLAFPLVMCVERCNSTSSDMSNPEANIFPWANLTAFADYRNQYLYPSSTVSAVAGITLTIESIHSRAVSFSGIGVNNYSDTLAPPTGPQWIRVYNKPDPTFVTTFATNAMGPLHLNWEGVKTITHTSGTAVQAACMAAPGCAPANPNPNALSDFISRDPADLCGRNKLETPFDFRMQDPAQTNILVDTLMREGTPLSPMMSLWDVTMDDVGNGCPGPQRAIGGTRTENPNNLTTAKRIDNKAFVWVFLGRTLPPPATIQQQIAEIIRLLVTPEGLRCTGLDLTPNGRLEDNPIRFPDGANYDPISPQVTSGKTVTGEETGDGSQRREGWVD